LDREFFSRQVIQKNDENKLEFAIVTNPTKELKEILEKNRRKKENFYVFE
jgi:hypothetical protein